MKVFVHFCAAVLAIAMPGLVHARDLPLRYVSPDKALTAVVTPLGRDKGETHIPDDDPHLEYECRVDIYDSKHHRLWSLDLSSDDGDHGRGVVFALWSPDSQWFVFSTVSSGGHHPWQYFTYAYSRRGNGGFHIDNFMGEVIDPKFKITRPDILSIRVFDRSVDNPKEDMPSKIVSASLWKLLHKTKPQEGE